MGGVIELLYSLERDSEPVNVVLGLVDFVQEASLERLRELLSDCEKLCVVVELPERESSAESDEVFDFDLSRVSEMDCVGPLSVTDGVSVMFGLGVHERCSDSVEVGDIDTVTDSEPVYCHDSVIVGSLDNVTDHDSELEMYTVSECSVRVYVLDKDIVDWAVSVSLRTEIVKSFVEDTDMEFERSSVNEPVVVGVSDRDVSFVEVRESDPVVVFDMDF